MAIENHQLIDIIKRQMGDKSLTDFALLHNFNRSTLSEVLHGARPVTGSIASAFGYIRVKSTHITFKKKASK